MNQGQRETAQLRRSAEEQITRLLTQLEDLDSLREARGTRAHAPRELSSILLRVALRTWMRRSTRAHERRRSSSWRSSTRACRAWWRVAHCSSEKPGL